jgi:hypothetical protein
VAQAIYGGLICVLSLGACGQQTHNGANKDSVKKQKPTVPEILGWLEAKVNAQQNPNYTMLRTDANANVGVLIKDTSVMGHEGCRVSVEYTYYRQIVQIKPDGTAVGEDVTGHSTQPVSSNNKMDFELTRLSPDARSVRIELEQGFGLWQVIAADPDPSGKNDLRLNFNDKDLALRATKALDDAIRLCGGKKIKELY